MRLGRRGVTNHAYGHLSPIAEAGAVTGQPYNAVAGAAVHAALEDARYGSKEAQAWLTQGQGRRWCETLGGAGYLEAAQADWRP